MSKNKELDILRYIAELLATGYINTAKQKAIEYYDKGIELKVIKNNKG
jgi:hypothetical protein